MRTDYPKIFKKHLEPYRNAGTTVSPNTLFADPALPSVKRETKLKHLKKFLGDFPSFAGVVEGVLPDGAGLIKAIEQKLGAKITEKNVVSANEECAKIVKSAAKPIIETYVQDSLANFTSGSTVSVPLPDLIDFLIDDYGGFVRGSGNGLVKIAGHMNERLLITCLQYGGLSEMKDFTWTGTKSDADIVIHSSARSKPRLGVEVKSYHARERLLRGLKDVTPPKVGAGYFVDATEFGDVRTRALINAGTAAVYMPAKTLARLDAKIRAISATDNIAAGSKFYRPLEQFATDMIAFTKSGTLPKF